MTPDELRSLADEANPEDLQGIYNLDPPTRQLALLAPDLARLCADLAEALEAIADMSGQISPLEQRSISRAPSVARTVLAKFSELSP